MWGGGGGGAREASIGAASATGVPKPVAPVATAGGRGGGSKRQAVSSSQHKVHRRARCTHKPPPHTHTPTETLYRHGATRTQSAMYFRPCEHGCQKQGRTPPPLVPTFHKVGERKAHQEYFSHRVTSRQRLDLTHHPRQALWGGGGWGWVGGGGRGEG